MDQHNILNQLQELEKKSTVLEPSANNRMQWEEAFTKYSKRYIDELNDKPSFSLENYDDDTLSNTDFRSENAIDDVLRLLKDHLEPPGLNPASGGHLGYIPGGGLYAAAVGDYLAAVTNKYAGVFYASPGAVRIENALINWTANVLGYNRGFGGNITSGGSIANLIAITTARDAKGIKGKDLHKTVIYMTKVAHHSLKKAIVIAGLRECVIREIALDKQYKMDVVALADQVKNDKTSGLNPFLVIGNAGSTDIGSIDPLLEISQVAKENDLWFHVDGAYGGYFLLLDECREKMKGIADADSVVLDPHKGLFLPYGTGIVLIKRLEDMKQAFSYEANYMQDTVSFEQEVSPAELSPELSKHFRSLRMWMPLKLHGEQPFIDALKEKLLLTEYFKQKVVELGFELLTEPELTVVAYRYVPNNGMDANEFNKRLMDKVHQDGKIFISSTNIDGNYILRFACLSFRTHRYHVDELLKLLLACKEEVLADM